jgi:hypothetical protein
MEVDGKSKFCVVSQNGLCHGDSGGPVFNPRDLDRFLIGIVSAGHTNCSEETPTVCINVVYYANWILNQMSDEERMAVLFTKPSFVVDFIVDKLTNILLLLLLLLLLLSITAFLVDFIIEQLTYLLLLLFFLKCIIII